MRRLFVVALAGLAISACSAEYKACKAKGLKGKPLHACEFSLKEDKRRVLQRL